MWFESLAGKYWQRNCVRWVYGSDIYVSIFLEHWKLKFTSHETSSQEGLHEQDVS